MIRINLLAVESQRTRTWRRTRLRRRVAAGCCSVLVVTASTIGVRVWSLWHEGAGLAAAVALADREMDRLAPALERTRDREAALERLAARVSWLTARRAQQDEPVRLLDEIGRSLPDGVWLTELRQAPAAIVLRGRAASLTALSDFVAGLERSRSVSPPVEVLGSQIDDRGGAADPLRFELQATLRSPGLAAPAGPG